MVAPAIIAGLGGAAIGAAADIFNSNRNINYQKLFAKKGIQWRVKDAKAAGLHPLYALGAQVPAFSPVSSSLGSDLSAAGQNIGAALERQLTPVQKQMLALEVQQKQAELRKVIKEGDYLDAEMSRIRSDRLRSINEQISAPIPSANVKEQGGAGSVFAGQVSTKLPPPGLIKQDAATSYSTTPGDPSLAGAATPSMREFTLPGNLPILLPGGMSGDPSEALETLAESPLLMWSVYRANVQKYGPSWGRQFRRMFLWPEAATKYWDASGRAARYIQYDYSGRARAAGKPYVGKSWR